MLEREVAAAHIALRSLQRTAGTFPHLRIHRDQAEARVEPRLRRKPRSEGRLHWASDRGTYRDMWVARRRQDGKRLFRLYFGSWGRTRRLSAYVVLFRGSPLLEVRLSPGRPPDNGVVQIEHRLAFFGKTYRKPKQLRRIALHLAERAGLRVTGERAQLGQFRVPSGHLKPSAREILRRIILCGLIKHSVGEAGRAGDKLPTTPAKPAPFSKKRVRFAKGQRAKIDVLLDDRFEAWRRHDHLVNQLAEQLAARGYRVESREPFDVFARRAQRVVIIEAKAWNRANLVGALRAAAGQLLYYAYLFGRDGDRRSPQLVAAIPFRPAIELMTFLERTAAIGLVWLVGNQFRGGPLARRLLPELLGSEQASGLFCWPLQT